jgi:hypothetical protein
MFRLIVRQAPLVGQVYGFSQVAMKVYNCTDPVNATKLAI